MHPCPVCNETNRKILIDFQQWRIQRCQGCGIGILDPMPNKSDLAQYYGESYFVDQYDEGLNPESKAFAKRISQEDHRVRFFRRIIKNGRLLDMGCGLGYFLYACRQAGYSVHGVDISESAATYLSEKLRIPVDVGEFENINFAAESFDIITMWHFLEHTHNPSACIEKAIQWLKPEGILVIDVPNYQSTDASHYGSDWVGWQLPFHLYHFSYQSLNYLLNKYQFRIVNSKDYHSEYIKEKLGKNPFLKIFARIIAKCYSGTSIAVVAKRL